MQILAELIHYYQKTLVLKGPLFEFKSKQDYIASLNGNLESDPEAEILSIIAIIMRRQLSISTMVN